MSTGPRLAIVGGGRWARVLAGVARATLPSVLLSLHSPSNAEAMRDWAKQQGWSDDEVEVWERWPAECGLKFAGVVIANRTREHADAALSAMECAGAVMVEKPLALSASVVQDLVVAASGKGVLLCAAHVLAFTRYLSRFAEQLPSGQEPQSVELIWTDPTGDQRYGENKSYDGTVSLCDDVMPHVISVLDPLLRHRLVVGWAKPERGGARTMAGLTSGAAEILLHLERDAPGRRRELEVRYPGAVYRLDFSPEPGIISAPGGSLSGDPDWGRAPRPLATLLAEFWQVCQAGECADPRLSTRLSIAAVEVAEAVTTQCHLQLKAWLESDPAAADADLTYARRELAAYSRDSG